ncbi:IS110 family transposase [Bdellovibrionota bacterium FG-2]
MSAKKISYKGKKVYVGIDVHLKTYSITVRCDGEIVHRVTMEASPTGVVTFLKRSFGDAERIYIVYEAGFSGFVLHRALVEGGIHNIVVNAASVEVAANDRVKTDRRDSKKLAEQLEVGRLNPVFVPDRAQELRRQLTRTREQVVETRGRVARQIKSKLHYFGLITCNTPKRILSNRILKEIQNMKLPEELADSLNLLIEQWRFLTLQLVELRKKFKEQSKKDLRLESVYRSVPGIGAVGARILSNEMGDLAKRFNNERELFKFTGLTPSEFSSGESVRRGHITHQGPPRIRHILIEAWFAIGKDPALKAMFEKIAGRRGRKIAIIAIARKLIGRIRACFRQEVTYQLGVCM